MKIKFQPEMFPAGTVFRLNDEAIFRRNGSLEYTTTEVRRNGVDSYVVATTTPANRPGEDHFPQDMMQAFHLDHINAIIKRGDGPLDIKWSLFADDCAAAVFREMENNQNGAGLFMIDGAKSSRTHYQIFSIELLVSHLMLKFMKPGHYVFDDIACGKALEAQSFIHTTCLLGTVVAQSAPKKRVNKWFRANMNRFLINLKKTAKKYDEAMAIMNAEDFDAAMDMSDDACELDGLTTQNTVVGGELDTIVGAAYLLVDMGKIIDEGDKIIEEGNKVIAAIGEYVNLGDRADAPAEEVHHTLILDDGNPVRVRFDMSEDIWNKVVVDSAEEMVVERESTQDFIVEYASRAELEKALVRFEGAFDHEEVK